MIHVSPHCLLSFPKRKTRLGGAAVTHPEFRVLCPNWPGSVPPRRDPEGQLAQDAGFCLVLAAGRSGTRLRDGCPLLSACVPLWVGASPWRGALSRGRDSPPWPGPGRGGRRLLPRGLQLPFYHAFLRLCLISPR